MAFPAAPLGGVSSPQAEPPSEASRQTPPGPPDGAVPSDQLAEYLKVITDPQESPATRRAVAILLLKSPLPGAAEAAAELLGPGSALHAQAAVCDALTETLPQLPGAFSSPLIEPLIQLLQGTDAALQSKAAAALAVYPNGQVARRLGALAGNAASPDSARLAAIAALAANVHRREVVEQLINLLDDPAPSVVDRVYAVLESASLIPQSAGEWGRDATKWRPWWESRKALDETAWLNDRVGVLSLRVRELAAAQQKLAATTDQREAELSGRLADFQGEAFRLTPPDQRDARLVEWMDDPVAIVRRTAMALMMQPLNDEGRRPAEPVRAALMKRLNDPLPIVRREALGIVGALAEPSDAPVVLALLGPGQDVEVRQAAFEALGRLRNLDALPAILAAIDDDRQEAAVVRAAATALARLAVLSPKGIRDQGSGITVQGSGSAEESPRTAPSDPIPDPQSPIPSSSTRSPIPDPLGGAAAPLKKRLAALPADDHATRAAILAAMAEIADPSFADLLAAQLGSPEPTVVRPAIRGLTAIGDATALPQVRVLAESAADPLVRQRAVEMVGKLGRADGDIDVLVRRSKRTVETSAEVRAAAWNAFLNLESARSPELQFADAARLQDDPLLEEAYWARFIGDFSSSLDQEARVESARDRLAQVLIAQSKFTEAIPHLDALATACAARKDAAWREFGLRLLTARLRAPDHKLISELIVRLTTDCPAEVRGRAVQEVRAYLDSETVAADAVLKAALLDELRKVPPDGLGPDWARLVTTTPGS